MNKYNKQLKYVTKLSNEVNAINYTKRCIKPMRVILGDDFKYWICTPALASILVKQGYEII